MCKIVKVLNCIIFNYNLQKYSICIRYNKNFISLLNVFWDLNIIKLYTLKKNYIYIVFNRFFNIHSNRFISKKRNQFKVMKYKNLIGFKNIYQYYIILTSKGIKILFNNNISGFIICKFYLNSN